MGSPSMAAAPARGPAAANESEWRVDPDHSPACCEMPWALRLVTAGRLPLGLAPAHPLGPFGLGEEHLSRPLYLSLAVDAGHLCLYHLAALHHVPPPGRAR